MKLVYVLVALLSHCCHAAAGPVPEAAEAAVKAYSAAFNSGDCQSMLELMTLAERRAIGASMCGILEEWHADGARDRLRAPSASASHGQYRMVIFPSSRAGFSAGQPALTDGAYVVHSSDAGRTWYVLDLDCLDERWMKVVYPPYRGKPKIPPYRSHALRACNDL